VRIGRRAGQCRQTDGGGSRARQKVTGLKADLGERSKNCGKPRGSAPREPEGGVDFEVDHFPGGFLGVEPLPELRERNVMDGDVFPGDAATLGLAGEAGGLEEVDEFRGETCGGGGGNEFLDLIGAIAGFFEQFAAGCFCERFAEMLGFIADDSGWDFDDGFLDGDAELFNEDDFVLRSDGEDADAIGGLGAHDKVPMSDALHADPGGFKQSFGGGCVGHGSGGVQVEDWDDWDK
jgi:hypothetical protein